MRYDNTPCAWVLLHVHQITDNDVYKRIPIEILDYLAREMLARDILYQLPTLSF